MSELPTKADKQDYLINNLNFSLFLPESIMLYSKSSEVIIHMDQCG